MERVSCNGSVCLVGSLEIFFHFPDAMPGPVVLSRLFSVGKAFTAREEGAVQKNATMQACHPSG